MVKTKRSALHTVYNIGYNSLPYRAAMTWYTDCQACRTAATTRFSPESIGCQKQTAPRCWQQSDQVGLYLASIHQMAPPKRGRTHLIIALLLIYRPRKDDMSYRKHKLCMLPSILALKVKDHQTLTTARVDHNSYRTAMTWYTDCHAGQQQQPGLVHGQRSPKYHDC